MTVWSDYMRLTQHLVRDTGQELINPATLTDYVNRARREVAMRSQCLRALTPISGPVETITVTAGGSGYTAPVVTISAPDSPGGQAYLPAGDQATAVATLAGKTIQSIAVTYGGSGYFQPTVTITDATGTGATAAAATAPIMTANYAQEVYQFSDIPLTALPGYGSVIAVRSVTIIYANLRYSLPQYSFSTYQAKIRQYPFQYQYVPTMCSQFGQGSGGSLYLYPLPSQPYQMELDCTCFPQDLFDDLDVEAIPDPWTQAVSFLAAHYAYLELQNLNAAEYYYKMFERQMPRYRNAASVGRTVNPYGRY